MTSDRFLSVAIAAALLQVAPPVAGTDYAVDVFVRASVVADPSPGRFSVCHGGTCEIVSQVALAEDQWRRVAELFAAPVAGAKQERARIAEAIARLETFAGALTGTAGDRAENGIGESWWSQMDCIDESTNSTTYLRMLASQGLLRFHRVEARVTRGFFIFGWPHTTAVISERETDARWAVDSWFHENGRPPEIVPLDLWKGGWRPGKPVATPPINADARQ